MKIYLNNKHIGSIMNASSDMFHIYGQFNPSAHYNIIEDTIKEHETLSLKSESSGLSDEEEHRFNKLVDEIYALGLTADHVNKIRDFKVINGICEFKFDKTGYNKGYKK